MKDDAENASRASIYKDETLESEPRRVTPSFLGTMQSVLVGLGGVAGASAVGLRTFRDEMSEDNLRRRGLNSGFLEGSAVAASRFFEELALVPRQVLEEVRQTSDRRSFESVECERLAASVVSMLRGARRSDDRDEHGERGVE